MRKSDIAKGLDLKATSIFIATVTALAVNSLLNNFTRVFDMHLVVKVLIAVFVAVFSLFSCVMIVRGFATVDKACKLSEKNENFYMGRNLTIFSVICIVFTVVLFVAVLLFSKFIAEYNSAEGLTASDVQARNNILVLTAVINIVMQFFAVSTPFIFYLWKIYKLTPESKKISNFALLAMIIFVVHLVISILNSVYSIRGVENSFLPGFTGILNTVKYLVLLAFFMIRRKHLLSIPEETE
ncbi:MAG: hypothetical protein J6Q94_05250 [Clostridia bacterium]|nr:hypothetical protein [Clostridia bacterium]